MLDLEQDVKNGCDELRAHPHKLRDLRRQFRGRFITTDVLEEILGDATSVWPMVINTIARELGIPVHIIQHSHDDFEIVDGYPL